MSEYLQPKEITPIFNSENFNYQNEMISYQNAQSQLNAITDNPIFSGTFSMSTIFNGAFNNNIIQTAGTLSNITTSSTTLIIKTTGNISYIDSAYVLMSDRLRLTTNTALDTLYSELMFLRGASSNIQTQLNTITSNNIFNGIFSMSTTFNGASNNFNGNIVQTAGSLSNITTSSTNFNVKTSGNISFADSTFHFLSDRLRNTTNTALDCLYSSLMYCKDASSNIQQQINAITSNPIFGNVASNIGISVFT